MIKKEYEKMSNSKDISNKMLLEKLKNEAYYLRCEKDQLKHQLSQMKSIKERYDESLEKLKKKYTTKKDLLKNTLLQNDILEKTNNELEQKINSDNEQVFI